jgi:hypothetical protein
MEKLGKLLPCPKLRVQRDPLRRGGARLLLQAHGRLGCLPGQGPLVHGHHERVSPVPCVATEEEVAKASGKNPAARKKRGRGNLGRKATPQNNGNSRSGKPRQAGKGSQQQQQQQQQKGDTDHRRFVIKKLNLELEVARTNAGARTNGTLYANVVRGAFTSPPPPLPLPPLPPPPPLQPAPEDDLERRQAVNRLFTLYESQHIHMMEIRALLRK